MVWLLGVHVVGFWDFRCWGRFFSVFGVGCFRFFLSSWFGLFWLGCVGGVVV